MITKINNEFGRYSKKEGFKPFTKEELEAFLKTKTAQDSPTVQAWLKNQKESK